MAVTHHTMAQIRQEESESLEKLQRARAEAERAAAERAEKQLLRELDDEDERIAEAREREALLPPESSQERENRELREKIERLEAEKRGELALASAPPQRGNHTAESRQYFRRDALRILRIERQGQERQDLEDTLGVTKRRQQCYADMDAAHRAMQEELARIDAQAEQQREAVRAQQHQAREAAERSCLEDIANKLAGADERARELIEVKI